jgi:hypothetical protein
MMGESVLGDLAGEGSRDWLRRDQPSSVTLIGLHWVGLWAPPYAPLLTRPVSLAGFSRS